MKNINICRMLFGPRALFGSAARKLGHDEPPLRSDLFSADQMEQHGKVLAGTHQLGTAWTATAPRPEPTG